VSGEPKPWTGFTVQVDTTLKKAVPVSSLLKLEAWVERREGPRKIWICARLSNELDGSIHCLGRGLFLLSNEAVSSSEKSNGDAGNDSGKVAATKVTRTSNL
jgi:hypothetical protein